MAATLPSFRRPFPPHLQGRHHLRHVHPEGRPLRLLRARPAAPDALRCGGWAQQRALTVISHPPKNAVAGPFRQQQQKPAAAEPGASMRYNAQLACFQSHPLVAYALAGHKPSASNQTDQAGRTAGRDSPASSAGQKRPEQKPAPSAKRPLSMLRHGSSAAPLPLPHAEPRQPQAQQEEERGQAGQAEPETAGPASGAAPSGGAADPVQPTAEGENLAGDVVLPTALEQEDSQHNGRSQQQGRSHQRHSQMAAGPPAPAAAPAPAASAGTHTTQTAARAAPAEGEVESPPAAFEQPPSSPGAARAGQRGDAGQGRVAEVGPSHSGGGLWSSDGEEAMPAHKAAAGKEKGRAKSIAAAEPDSPAAAAKLRAQRSKKQAQRPVAAKGGQKLAGGRKKAGLAAMKKGGKVRRRRINAKQCSFAGLRDESNVRCLQSCSLQGWEQPQG